MSENPQLQESQKQLLQDAEELKEQVSEVKKQKIIFEDSKIYAKQVLYEKEYQLKSLTECFLKMPHWATVLGEDLTDYNLGLKMKSNSENGALLDNQPKEALKKLNHAAKLKASFARRRKKVNLHSLTEVDKKKGITYRVY